MYFYGSISSYRIMRSTWLLILIIFFAFAFNSCNHKLEVNAPWKDITVVYGLLDQNDTVHYLKITKAFLGAGDALSFARIPDSSNYQEKLDVRLEGWEMISQYDSSLKQTILFDTVTITNKLPGDSIFYFPDQLVYRSMDHTKLNSTLIYKLFIKEPKTGKEITSQTPWCRKYLRFRNRNLHPQGLHLFQGRRTRSYGPPQKVAKGTSSSAVFITRRER